MPKTKKESAGKGKVFFHFETSEDLRHAAKLAALTEKMDLKDWLNAVLRRQVGLDGMPPKRSEHPG